MAYIGGYRDGDVGVFDSSSSGASGAYVFVRVCAMCGCLLVFVLMVVYCPVRYMCPYHQGILAVFLYFIVFESCDYVLVVLAVPFVRVPWQSLEVFNLFATYPYES